MRRARILAVDDNLTNLAILEEILGEEFEVRTARSGEEGLEIAGAFRPALVLLDVMMPGMDGYEVCRRVREAEELRHTKVIMVSAKALVSERLEGYEAGADDYLTKPFQEEELLLKIRVFLRLRTAEEVDQLKTEVLSLLAHEVRTPLNCLLLPAEVLKTAESMSDEERRRLGEIMYENALNLQSFFEKALALSAIRAGKWRPRLAPVELHRLVRLAVEEVSAKAHRKGLSVEEEIEGPLTVSADSKGMVRALGAILDNAVRFTEEGGRILIRIAAEGRNGSASIADSGAGIDPGVLPAIFDELAEAQCERHSLGRGLSLALASRIVECHGGSIAVESTPGEGATFTVSLPLAPVRDDFAPEDISCLSRGR